MNELNEASALVYLMVTMAAADGQLGEDELASVATICDTLPVFEGLTRDQLIEHANACGVLLEDEDGIDRILSIVHEVLPERLYETAYAVAVEVAAADLQARQEELRLLEMLRDKLDLDKLDVAAIEHSAKVRYRLGSAPN
ncbi:MAG: tellurite resistance TerB family protein [Pseudomonadota bacterium]